LQTTTIPPVGSGPRRTQAVGQDCNVVSGGASTTRPSVLTHIPVNHSDTHLTNPRPTYIEDSSSSTIDMNPMMSTNARGILSDSQV
jgi:hypothetical protein